MPSNFNGLAVSGSLRPWACTMAAVLLFSLTAASCAVVTPLPKRTHGPQGPTENIDLRFIRPGLTTREEVVSKLKPYNTGFPSEHFFLGRWKSSTWAYGVLTTGARDPGGRVWGNHNLLVEFDDKGVVKNFEVFPDKLLVKKLGPVAADQKPLDPSDRIELSVTHGASAPLTPGEITLSHGSFEFIGTESQQPAFRRAADRPLDFTIAATRISSIGSMVLPHADPVYTTQAIHFTERVEGADAGGRRLNVQMTVPDLVVLLRFIADSKNACPGQPGPARPCR